MCWWWSKLIPCGLMKGHPPELIRTTSLTFLSFPHILLFCNFVICNVAGWIPCSQKGFGEIKL